MSGRYERLDSDEEQLPAGMSRVGYDADTQVYTFQDADGSLWEGAAGQRYGTLHRVGDARPDRDAGEDLAWQRAQLKAHERAAWRYLLPFLLLVGLFLLGVFRLTRGGSVGPQRPGLECEGSAEAYRIVRGDTCYDVAQRFGTEVDKLKAANPGLDCAGLVPGSDICVPQNGDVVVPE